MSLNSSEQLEISTMKTHKLLFISPSTKFLQGEGTEPSPCVALDQFSSIQSVYWLTRDFSKSAQETSILFFQFVTYPVKSFILFKCRHFPSLSYTFYVYFLTCFATNVMRKLCDHMITFAVWSLLVHRGRVPSLRLRRISLLKLGAAI